LADEENTVIFIGINTDNLVLTTGESGANQSGMTTPCLGQSDNSEYQCQSSRQLWNDERSLRRSPSLIQPLPASYITHNPHLHPAASRHNTHH